MLQHEAGWAPQGGMEMEHSCVWSKNLYFVVLGPDLASPGRDLFREPIGLRFWAIGRTADFGYPGGQLFPQILIPVPAFAYCGQACHAILWTDRGPGLRSELVISCPSASKVQKSKFPTFSGVRVRPKHPSLTTSLQFGPTEGRAQMKPAKGHGPRAKSQGHKPRAMGQGPGAMGQGPETRDQGLGGGGQRSSLTDQEPGAIRCHPMQPDVT